MENARREHRQSSSNRLTGTRLVTPFVFVGVLSPNLESRHHSIVPSHAGLMIFEKRELREWGY